MWFVLLGFDVLQNRAEVFVLGDGRVGHTLVFVEDGIGDRNALPAHFKSPVQKGLGINIFARQAAGDLILSRDDLLSLIGEGKLCTETSFITETEDIPQPVSDT